MERVPGVLPNRPERTVSELSRFTRKRVRCSSVKSLRPDVPRSSAERESGLRVNSFSPGKRDLIKSARLSEGAK